MRKYPSEIFGYYWSDTTCTANETRERRWCPFHNSKCHKKSRLVDYPFGVCTAHTNGREIALCPRRFLQDQIVFHDIARRHFNSIDNVLVFSEIGLRGIGNFDFVMIKHKPLSVEIEDFCAIEFQTGQTTSTGKLVGAFKDYMETGKFEPEGDYGFGINEYDIWKRTFTQILNKGIIMEKWKRKIFWVVQDPIFEYFVGKYRLGSIGYSEGHSTVFSLYDLVQENHHLQLRSTRTLSSTIDELFDAFRANDDIPPVEKFLLKLQEKVSGGLRLGLRLDAFEMTSIIDAPRPSSTGRVREREGGYESGSQE